MRQAFAGNKSLTPSVRRTMAREHGPEMSWITKEEFPHPQPIGNLNNIQINILYDKPRAALETIPQLTENPLFEGSNQEECKQRVAASTRLSLEESHFKPVTRRGSLSLSAKDYEGIWRAVQEDVSRSPNESKSPLEDFKEFRQKLALLKQDMTGATEGRSGCTSTCSTRSLNISPSRPTSPLKRLSVMASRKSATSSGLNSQLGRQQRVPPTVQKIAVTMRAEGLFKLPSPASISPVPQRDPSQPTEQPLRSSTPPSKRRFNVLSYRIEQFRQKSLDMTASAETTRTNPTTKSGEIRVGKAIPEVHEVREESHGHSRRAEDRHAEEDDRTEQSRTSGEVQAHTGDANGIEHTKRWGSASSTASERKSTCQSTTTSIRRLPVPCGGPKAAKTPPQQVPAKKPSGSSSRDWKVRCIPIPRPVCYSANILE